MRLIFRYLHLLIVSFLQGIYEHRLWSILPGSNPSSAIFELRKSCAISDELLNLSGPPLFSCFAGMLRALTYRVGGLNTSDKWLACGEHPDYVSNCPDGCFERSVSSPTCGAVWGEARWNSRVAAH